MPAAPVRGRTSRKAGCRSMAPMVSASICLLLSGQIVVKNLGPSAGKEAVAVIKATSVMFGVNA